ncbi:EamA family transporter [Sphingobium sp. B11D3A]|uniref:EamA family transporter n=1 Tax=Sphingobium sp. B11D3A TaxID=2940574 RepID=UPI0022256EE2|nr:EamA family transporter [Sphingobium sp. B11D3A]MCW2391505.1 drug/metabolite transporter (DMT)-like permease [Sphingobium sp. B11D3A]
MISSPIWLPATLLAGLLQAWRTAVQRRVGQMMSVNAAGLVRYLYGLPFAAVLMLGYHALLRDGLFPAFSSATVIYSALGGLAQILATNLLLMAFHHRNFVVGTAYSKTEAAQGALLSILLLGETLSLLAWIGIAIGVVGVMLLSTGGKRMSAGDFLRALGQPAARYGIASGFFFALTAIAIRRATMDVATPDPISAALTVLVITVALQTVMQGGYLLWREPEQVRRVFETWRVSGQVGFLSALGSACWFTGFATAPVALVRIVGQSEVVFTLSFAHFYLRERLRRSEVIGLLLVVSAVVLALLGARD